MWSSWAKPGGNTGGCHTERPATYRCFQNLLYDTLQYIAVSKRDFHQNHYILTKTYSISMISHPKKTTGSKKGYYQKLHAAERKKKKYASCWSVWVLYWMEDYHWMKNSRSENCAGRPDQAFPLIGSNNTKKDFLNGRGIQGLIRTYIAWAARLYTLTFFYCTQRYLTLYLYK